MGEVLGCLQPALYKLLRCHAASKKAKYLVVKMTSASGCLPPTIPKTIRRARAEAGLGEGAETLEPQNPESYGDPGLRSVRQSHSLHQALAQRGVKAMFVLPQWCLGLQPCTSGCRDQASPWLEGDLHPFLHASKSAAWPLHPGQKGKSSLPGYLHGKTKAFLITFLGMPGTPVACLHIAQGIIQPMKELPGDWHPHY